MVDVRLCAGSKLPQHSKAILGRRYAGTVRTIDQLIGTGGLYYCGSDHPDLTWQAGRPTTPGRCPIYLASGGRHHLGLIDGH